MEFREKMGNRNWGIIGTYIIFKFMRLGGHPRVNVDREEAGQKTEPWGIPTLRDGKR